MTARVIKLSPVFVEFLGRSHYNTCRLDDVFWEPVRGGRALRHAGGKKNCKFPCAGSCEHVDCAMVREES